MDKSIEEKLNEILDRGLCNGQGTQDGQMCIEAAIAIACGEPFSDEPTCVAVAVRAHSIALNDSSYWSSSKVRADSLRAYALNQLGCKMIDEKEFARRLAIRNVVEVLPMCSRALAALPVLSPSVVEALKASIALCESATDLASAESAAESAESAAESAANSAAESAAESANSAAESAESAAKSAAKSAAWSAKSAAESANSAAESAESAKSAAESAAESAWSAKSAAESAAKSAAWSAAKSAAKSAAWSAADTVLIKAAAVANEVLASCKKDAGL